MQSSDRQLNERNAVILGSGRYGTSMVAGALATSEYRLSSDLLAGEVANPTGLFESRAVSSIKADIRAEYVSDSSR